MTENDIPDLRKHLNEIEQLAQERSGVVELIAAILQEMPVAVLGVNEQNEWVVWNHHAGVLFGLPPYAAPPEDWPHIYRCAETKADFESGTYMPPARLPLVRAMNGETVVGQRFYANGNHIEATAGTIEHRGGKCFIACLWIATEGEQTE